MRLTNIDGQRNYAAERRAPAPSRIKEMKIALDRVRHGNDNGVEVNISDEARYFSVIGKLTHRPQENLGETSNGLPDISDDILKNGMTATEYDEHIKEVRSKPGSRFIPIDAALEDRYAIELYNATSLGWRPDGYSGDFALLSAKYADLRESIEGKYSGDELERHLTKLDEGYDKVVDGITRVAEMEIRVAATMQGFLARISARESMTGDKPTNLMNVKVNYDTDAYNEAMNTLMKQVSQSIKNIGALSKQYILEGNAAPVSEKDLADFTAYISQGTDDSAGAYSPETLDSLSKALGSSASVSKAEKYAALSKLSLAESGINDKIKAGIVRSVTFNDRYRGFVPNAYKETTESMWNMMLEWEKTSD